MKGRYVLSSNEDPVEGNIYANKSALILAWLLKEGLNKGGFSLREVAKEVGVSIGLVQRVFQILASQGFVRTEGLRTGKVFFFTKPKLLLESWLKHYNIMKKCKVRSYYSGLPGRKEMIEAIKKAPEIRVVLALHSAAEAHKCKNTNLDTLEIYMLNSSDRLKLEKILQLEPRERGYEVLLIEPYYKSLLSVQSNSNQKIGVCSPLLTFLDLFHFPLRGYEQAEFMAKRIPELKRIFEKENPYA